MTGPTSHPEDRLRYPPKSQAPEFFDAPAEDPIQFAGLLETLRRINRWYGGRSLILGYLERLAKLLPQRPLTILDVATASADIPAAIATWSRGRGIAVRIAALDISPDILAVAQRITAGLPEVSLIRGNALSLPFRNQSVDIVICALTLHHFSFAGATAVLREIARVARAGFVVNDVLRSWPAYLGALADAWLCTRNRLARHDTPVSVLRSFTWPEFSGLARAAGLDGLEIRRHPIQRVAMVRWPTGARTQHGG